MAQILTLQRDVLVERLMNIMGMQEGAINSGFGESRKT